MATGCHFCLHPLEHLHPLCFGVDILEAKLSDKVSGRCIGGRSFLYLDPLVSRLLPNFFIDLHLLYHSQRPESSSSGGWALTLLQAAIKGLPNATIKDLHRKQDMMSLPTATKGVGGKDKLYADTTLV